MTNNINIKLYDKLWIFFVRIKFFRKILYTFKRYKKLSLLKNLQLNENSFILDFGSNNGIVSFFLYDLYQSNIYAYEPNLYAYEVQKKLFKNIDKICVLNFAVSSNTGTTKLFYHKVIKTFNSMSLSESSSLEIKKSNISLDNFKFVKTLSINEILENFKKIDFIKIDIEGHEYKILPEIIKNISKIDLIFCEMHGSSPGHRDEFRDDFFKFDKIIKEKNLSNKIIYW